MENKPNDPFVLQLGDEQKKIFNQGDQGGDQIDSSSNKQPVIIGTEARDELDQSMDLEYEEDFGDDYAVVQD